jgi:GMP reductase
MRIEYDLKLDFSDVLIEPKRSELNSRKEVEVERSFSTRNGMTFKGVPIIAANMATGTFPMLKVFSKNKMFVAIARHLSDEWTQNLDSMFLDEFIDYGFYTIGMSDIELKRLIEFKSGLLKDHQEKLKICIDIANGYIHKFPDFIREVRRKFNYNVIIAGNVCTPEMTQEIILAGADFVKIGNGQGAKCLSRLKTGCGVPQLSAAIACSDTAHGLDAGIILDGGMASPGDICKAFCANSDMVMLGTIFAGTDECEGNTIEKYYATNEYENIISEKNSISIAYKPVIEKKLFKSFYGMSSDISPLNLNKDKSYRTSEGREDLVPYIGPVQKVIDDILGGIRSCGTYIGAKTVKNFGKCATFIRVSRQHALF